MTCVPLLAERGNEASQERQLSLVYLSQRLARLFASSKNGSAFAL